MKIKEIRWKANANTGGLNAKDAFEAIEQIRKKLGGEVSPDDIVAAAKSKQHKLHSVFEWDDTAAAKEHRLNQSRTLLRSIEVVYAEMPDRPMRSYEIIAKKKRGDEQSKTIYRTSDEAMSDPETRDALIADAIRQAMAFRRRFQGLRELQLIFEAIDQVSEQIVHQQDA